METWEIVLVIAICFVLMFKRWFWFVAFTTGSLAAGFELLANLMHFHIAATLGYATLTLACWAFATAIADGSPHSGEKTAQETHPSPTHPDWSPH